MAKTLDFGAAAAPAGAAPMRRSDAYQPADGVGEVLYLREPSVGFLYDPLNPAGVLEVSNPNLPAVPADDAGGGEPRNQVSQNFGWNSGAHSLQTLPLDWVGLVAFDIPDVQGARPGGVAIGLAPVSALPTQGRSGYGHLQHGLVFTASKVKVIFATGVAREVPYADIRAARMSGTDQVYGLMYGDYIKWVVNGLPLFAGSFSMPENYALDATLYTAFDTVHDPAFIAGDWSGDFPELDGGLNGALPGLSMTGDATPGSALMLMLAPLAVKLADGAYSDMACVLPPLAMDSAHSDGAIVALPPLEMRAYESSTYGAVEVALGALQFVAAMAEPDGDVVYSVLAPSLPGLRMTATIPAAMTGSLVLPALAMRATWQTQYAEIAASVPGLRMIGYGGEQTPLLQIVEAVGSHAPVRYLANLSVAVVEQVGGGSSVVMSVTTTADATERITVQESLSALQTFAVDAFERLGVLERTRLAVLHDGHAVDLSEAWVVNADTGATTRYGTYGFNSFASVAGKYFGARADGVYVLEGSDDAGQPITSGVSFGKHDFGTQALKQIDAVYVGVSSTGALFLKVGDGVNTYTYRARRNDERMKVQRFDLGRGLRTNYYSFDLVSEGDAFELDSVTFKVLASQRRI